MAAVLEHIFDYHFLLNEANRVLRKGGALLVQVPNLGYWKEVRKVILRKQPHWARDMQHIHLWTKAFLKEILQKHQFEVKAFEADRINLPLFRWVKSIWLEKKLASWGPVLIATAFKECTAKIVDGRLAHLYKKVDEIDKRTVEVVED